MGKVMSTAIKDKGIFDMGELYSLIKEWLTWEGYGDEKKTFQEEVYVERIKGDSKQIEIKWCAEKFMGPYLLHTINITFNILGMKDIEVEIDGKKIGTNKLDLSLKMDAKVTTDRQGKFKKRKFIKKLYEDYIINERISASKSMLSAKAYTLADEIKEYLELRRA
ncbi:hypothetical protein HON86_03095 [Candidatus Woesearchaeota archaeon]|jgi:hypothetical protein|nr:hypothetical protein [Candidatus Woesearchaeota archaeon]MBT4835576.1 hypothetical protein [Candidatus Woesearchaeota archaeon]MBT6734934.1 hypothetical protein [Candidatus Woesearchaeota archaeon]MBT7169769.1 hypothetical protein [Candidatus Woesearchaeota archaeon]MBT7474433.1 hypothetical protein [Candidatus Woesearchaeota archaeon]